MTEFVDVRDRVRWVAATDPEQVVAGIARYVAEDLARWESFDETPRVGTSSGRRAPGRTSAAQVTVLDSVGFAIEDFSGLRSVRDAVRGTPHVSHIDLVAEPEDPEDLFGTVSALSPIGV